MRKLLFAALMALASSAVSSAALVTFNTTGSALACGSAVNCSFVNANQLNFTNGGFTLNLTYTANTVTNLNAGSGGATTNFGSIALSCLSCTGSTTFNISGATLQLNINQTSPATGAQNVFGVGTFNGTFSLTSGNFGGIGSVLFPSTNVTLPSAPTVTYVLQQPVPPPTNGYSVSITNATSLQGAVISNEVPEPSTLALMGLGLAAMGLIRRRR